MAEENSLERVARIAINAIKEIDQIARKQSSVVHRIQMQAILLLFWLNQAVYCAENGRTPEESIDWVGKIIPYPEQFYLF